MHITCRPVMIPLLWSGYVLLGAGISPYSPACLRRGYLVALDRKMAIVTILLATGLGSRVWGLGFRV